MNKLFLAVITLLLLNSCASKKNIILFQDIENFDPKEDQTASILRIKKNDLLTIIVSSIDGKSAVPFNLPAISLPNSEITAVNGQQRLQTYFVDVNGEIQFPILGTLQLIGMTTNEATNFIKLKLLKYIKDPIVNLRISNFEISVMGEVARPGVYNVNDERITLLEALSRAGDLTIFGKRKNVLVIREENGVKTHNKIDLTSSEALKSPYYFLQQNDVVIVSPNGAQIQSSASNRNNGVFISIAGIIITVITLLTR